MKYMVWFSVMFIGAFLCDGCGTREWETNLYAQKIEGSSKILYKYNASGGRDTMVSGYIVLDSTETFEVDVTKNLPFLYLENIPSKNLIEGINCEDPDYGTSDRKLTELFTPLRVSNQTENDIEVITKTYQYEGFSSRRLGLGTFEFESFKETRDSLFFYNLNDIKSLEPQHLDSLKLKKSTIVIRQHKNLEIISIDIDDVVLSKGTNEILYSKTYFLTPKSKMKSNLFSNYGIFKERL